MTAFIMTVFLVIFVMIYALGHWHWKECRRHRRAEAAAELDREVATADRAEIREVAEAAEAEAAACAAVIDRIGRPRRRLHAVRDNKTGVSTWDWNWE